MVDDVDYPTKNFRSSQLAGGICHQIVSAAVTNRWHAVANRSFVR